MLYEIATLRFAKQACRANERNGRFSSTWAAVADLRSEADDPPATWLRLARSTPFPVSLRQCGDELTNSEQDLRFVRKKNVVIGTGQFDYTSRWHAAP